MAAFTGGFNAQVIVGATMKGIAWGLVGVLGYFAYRKSMWDTKAWIINQRGSDTGIAYEDYIYKKKNKGGDMEWRLRKGKCVVREIPEHLKMPFGKKAAVLLVRGTDGQLRYCQSNFMNVENIATCADCGFEISNKLYKSGVCPSCKSKRIGFKKVRRPYINPVEKEWYDWMYHTVMKQAEKYTVKTTLEAVAPFMTIAVTGIICVIMLSLTFKQFTGG